MIRIENLCKKYGDIKVLDSFSLTVPKGSVYGLMGLNGAGKTTIIKHLAGFVVQDSGTVTIDNKSVIDNEELKSRVLVIPDEVFFFRGYSLKDMRGIIKVYTNAGTKKDSCKWQRNSDWTLKET